MTKFVLKIDFTERLGQIEKEIWDELNKKQEKTNICILPN